MVILDDFYGIGWNVRFCDDLVTIYESCYGEKASVNRCLAMYWSPGMVSDDYE